MIMHSAEKKIDLCQVPIPVTSTRLPEVANQCWNQRRDVNSILKFANVNDYINDAYKIIATNNTSNIIGYRNNIDSISLESKTAYKTRIGNLNYKRPKIHAEG